MRSPLRTLAVSVSLVSAVLALPIAAGSAFAAAPHSTGADTAEPLPCPPSWATEFGPEWTANDPNQQCDDGINPGNPKAKPPVPPSPDRQTFFRNGTKAPRAEEFYVVNEGNCKVVVVALPESLANTANANDLKKAVKAASLEFSPSTDADGKPKPETGALEVPVGGTLQAFCADMKNGTCKFHVKVK
ncbi:hypothetical protein [Streptomyces sp. BPTC-684]|uniref:hypothetical protein n=1 Tax=Streptomyces sp. BPTC-684 TaxID=3043734 RepID=UPI0024B0DDC2|nr:hypothetical protein [Streptomyces sp. BPTC-684]WHM37960.1 hypothetical protein QIY60_14280 [Streptomyces sp. BPTC-684]